MPGDVQGDVMGSRWRVRRGIRDPLPIGVSDAGRSGRATGRTLAAAVVVPALLLAGCDTDDGLAPEPLEEAAPEGETDPLPVSLINTGEGLLEIDSLTTAESPFTLDDGSCGDLPIEIEVGESCTLDYRFAPEFTGAFDQEIQVDGPALESAGSFTLTGVGAEAGFQADVPDVDFGTLPAGQASHETVTVTNTGDLELEIESASGPSAPFGLAQGSCLPLPAGLEPGGSCTLVVEFQPEEADGIFSDMVTVSHSAPDSPFELTLAGESSQALPEAVAIPVSGRAGQVILAGLLLALGMILLLRRSGRNTGQAI